MLVNFSSPSNNSLSSTSFDLSLMYCYTTSPASFIIFTYLIINVTLFLPLCIYIIHHGVQQWRKKRSNSSTATMSHSDIFTYHLVTMEMIGLFGCILIACTIYSNQLKMLTIGFGMLTLTYLGETFFHVLTCLERYLAVVHPIIYLSLKNEKGVRVRIIIPGCVWLLCFVTDGLLQMEELVVVVNFSVVIPSLLIISFCSVSVLCVLIRPGPGEQGGSRERIDQSKQKAFYTIVAILGVLVGRFVWDLTGAILFITGQEWTCWMITLGLSLNIPRGLVLPLLFLHKAGKSVCRKK